MYIYIYIYICIQKFLTNVQTKCNNDYHDATMNLISWNHDFPSQNPFRGF